MLAGGVALLTMGAEWMVRGGSRMSRKLGVSSIIVGLTVVSYGTSFPEFLVSSISATKGHTELALGNVIGSNICNIGLVLGVAALIRPMRASRQTARQDMPAMAVVSLAVCLMTIDGRLGRLDGALLALGSISYTLWHVFKARRQYLRASMLPDFAERSKKEGSTAVNLLLILGGGVGLWLGSEGVVRGAVSLSERFALDMRFVGLTVVALGTSLPELAASTVAAFRREEGIGLGNVIGSNLLNILFVLGFTAVIRPIPVDVDLTMLVDMGVMLLVAYTLWPILHLRAGVSRPSALLLLCLYAGYIGYRAWSVFG
jgi:cation:H+ antiporter